MSPFIPREIPLLWARKVDREIIQVTAVVVIVVINAVAWIFGREGAFPRAPAGG